MAYGNDNPKSTSDDSAEKNKVVVTTKNLRDSEPIYRTWGEKISTDSGPLASIFIAPGDFPAAHRFRDIANQRIGNLWSNATNIGNAFKSTGADLLWAADSYDKAEDKSKDDAIRGSKLATDTGKNAPGAGSAVELPAGATPPTEPQKAPTPEGRDPAKPKGGG
jgi:hypothetical protein